MPDQLQLRGGTTAQHTSFTGASKEVTVDTTKKTAVVHDGSTVGGVPLLREDGSNSALTLGSAGTPSIKFTGDPDTGIYSPGANQLAVATNGTGRLFVDASGNVGVGTASITAAAGTKLQLESAGSTRLNITANASGYAAIDFGDSADRDAGRIEYYNIIDSMLFHTAASERLRITSAGLVGIGTTSPVDDLTVEAQQNAGGITVTRLSGTPRIKVYGSSVSPAEILFGDVVSGSGSEQGRISYDNSTDALRFFANINERARIDSSGRLLVGTSTARSVGGLTNQVQVEGVNAGTYSQSWVRNVAGAGGATIFLGKSRSGSVGGVTIVNTADQLGGLHFVGADGVDLNTPGASIEAYVDGTPGADDMPGRLVFSTTPDGASSPTERLRITSTGQVRLAGAGITFNGDTAAANELDDYEEGTWTPSLGGTATYHAQIGTYTKTGNVVTVSGRIHVNIKGTGSGTIVSGLPFTSAASYPYGIAIGKYLNIASSAFTVYGELSAGSSLFELFCTTAAGTGNYIASVFADSTQITFTFTYRV